MRTHPTPVLLTLLAAVAISVAACGTDATAPVAPSAAHDVATVVDRSTASIRWQAVTRDIVGRHEFNPLTTARSYALVAVAQYDAVIAARNDKSKGKHPSPATAAATAAARVLFALYPSEQPEIDAQLAADQVHFATLPSEHETDPVAGAAIGQTIAAAVLARAATDGSAGPWTGTAPTGPGIWTSAPLPARPLAPYWGTVRPWVLRFGAQFRPPTPPAFGSPTFLAGLAEVRQISDTRTPEQLQLAQFWQAGFGPGEPFSYFNTLGAQYAASQNLTEEQSTRLFALLHMAMMDASIGCWDAKYAFWYIRPYQADPQITTPVGRPNFPSYPSAHSCFSGAATGVLSRAFPSHARELSDLLLEIGEARIDAGVHYRFDVTAGATLGTSVARLVFEKAPREHAPIPLD
jgi:hypothetical protein